METATERFLHWVALRTKPVSYAVCRRDTGHQTIYPTYEQAEDEVVRLLRSPDRPDFDLQSIHFLLGKEYRKPGIIRV